MFERLKETLFEPMKWVRVGEAEVAHKVIEENGASHEVQIFHAVKERHKDTGEVQCREGGPIGLGTQTTFNDPSGELEWQEMVGNFTSRPWSEVKEEMENDT